MSHSWPNRCWLEPDLIVEAPPVNSLGVGLLEKNAIVPLWFHPHLLVENLEEQLTNNGFEILFEQTAMYLDLKNSPIEEPLSNQYLSIQDEQNIDLWVDIAARSFEYEIDSAVIQRIITDPNVQLLTVYLDNKPAATAMLFNTDNVVGVHQVGVLPNYRGKGIADKLMQHIINQCRAMPARYITLQASVAGKKLYQNLGFKEQFKIKNYQRPL